MLIGRHTFVVFVTGRYTVDTDVCQSQGSEASPLAVLQQWNLCKVRRVRRRELGRWDLTQLTMKPQPVELIDVFGDRDRDRDLDVV